MRVLEFVTTVMKNNTMIATDMKYDSNEGALGSEKRQKIAIDDATRNVFNKNAQICDFLSFQTPDGFTNATVAQDGGIQRLSKNKLSPACQSHIATYLRPKAFKNLLFSCLDWF